MPFKDDVNIEEYIRYKTENEFDNLKSMLSKYSVEKIAGENLSKTDWQKNLRILENYLERPYINETYKEKTEGKINANKLILEINDDWDRIKGKIEKEDMYNPKEENVDVPTTTPKYNPYYEKIRMFYIKLKEKDLLLILLGLSFIQLLLMMRNGRK